MNDIRSLLQTDKPFFRAVENDTQIRRSSDNTRTTVIINTTVQDRHGTFIDPMGGDMENYRKNPVFLINHDYDLLAGSNASVELDGNRWKASVNDEDWDLNDTEIVRWFNKVKNGIMKMASIGFMPREIDWDYEYAGQDGRTRTGVMIRKWELLEWSFVTVGSNPNALVTSRNVSMNGISEKLDRIMSGEIELSEKLLNALSERFVLKPAAPAAVIVTEPADTVARAAATTVTETRQTEDSGTTVPASLEQRLLSDPDALAKIETALLRKLGKA